MEATITVRRKPAVYTDRARTYKILVDGEERGKLKHGESLTVPVPPGRHTVRAKIDWARSPDVEVELAEGETVSLSVENSAGNPLAAGASAFFRPGKYLSLERDQ